MTREKVVLIVAIPGPLRDSLNLFLKVLPQVGRVVFAPNAPSARRATTAHHPALAVIDMGLPDADLGDLVRWMAAGAKGSRSLVLVEDQQQQQEMIEAGADAVVIKGHPAAQLFRIITDLLQEEEEKLPRAALAGPLPRALLKLARDH
jgi:DNA-binding NarL/FixJ family response regulator